MCLIKQLLFFFPFASLEFWGTSAAFPNNSNFAYFFSNNSNHSLFDVALLAYPSKTNLTKDSAAEVEKLHIKSIKDIKSIIVRFLVQI